MWNHYRLRFKHLLLNKTPRREAGPGSVVRVRTAAPRFFPRLSFSLSFSPPFLLPLPRLFLSFLLFLYPPCNERSFALLFIRLSLSLSFLLPLFWFPYIGASRKSRILGHPVFSIFRFARDTLSRPPRRRPVPRVACCLSDTKERIEPHSAVEPAKDERRRSRGDVMHSPR